jgi:hypothetical protein
MPQAQDWLQEKFSTDLDALLTIDSAFTIDSKYLIRPRPGATPTQEQWDAVQYLLEEWDFGLDEGPEPEEII